jgi:hypothetical protein
MAHIGNVSVPIIISSIPLPLAGLGIASSSVPQSLRPLDTGAKCSSQVTSLFGNAGLVGFAGAPRQSRSHQHPIPLAVRSRSDIMRTLPCKREPWNAKPCQLPSERAKPVSSWSGACFVPCAFETSGDVRLVYRQFKWCHPAGIFMRGDSLMLSLLERTVSGVGR